LLDFVSSITAPALFYLRASCPNESFYHLHPCKRPALFYLRASSAIAPALL